MGKKKINNKKKRIGMLLSIIEAYNFFIDVLQVLDHFFQIKTLQNMTKGIERSFYPNSLLLCNFKSKIILKS